MRAKERSKTLLETVGIIRHTILCMWPNPKEVPVAGQVEHWIWKDESCADDWIC